MICTCVHSAGVVIGCHVCRPENFIKEEHNDVGMLPYTSYEPKKDWRKYSRDLKHEKTYESSLDEIDIFLKKVDIEFKKLMSYETGIVLDFGLRFDKIFCEIKHTHYQHKELRKARKRVKRVKRN